MNIIMLILLIVKQSPYKLQKYFNIPSVSKFQIKLINQKVRKIFIQIQNWKYGVYLLYQQNLNDIQVKIKWDLVNPDIKQFSSYENDDQRTYQFFDPKIIREGQKYLDIKGKISNSKMYFFLQYYNSDLILQISYNKNSLLNPVSNINCERKLLRMKDFYCGNCNNIFADNQYFLKNHYVCQKIPIGYKGNITNYCNSSSINQYCPFEGMVLTDTFTCKNNQLFKNTSVDGITCDKCSEGQYPQDDKCQKCTIQNCKVCTKNYCLKCNSGFYLRQNYCYRCDSICEQCQGQPNICTACSNNVLYNNLCQCKDECTSCKKSYDNCLSCKSYYFHNSSTNKCECSGTCKYCTSNSPEHCISCIENYVLDTSKNNCTCTLPCITCENTLTNCLSCQVMKNQVLVLDHNGKCISCGYGCILCNKKFQCSRTISGYFVDLADKKPKKCNSNCKNCKQIGNCKQCIKDYLDINCLCTEFLFYTGKKCQDIRNFKTKTIVKEQFFNVQIIFHLKIQNYFEKLQISYSNLNFLRNQLNDKIIFINALKNQNKQVTLCIYLLPAIMAEFKIKVTADGNIIFNNYSFTLPSYSKVNQKVKQSISTAALSTSKIKKVLGFGLVSKLTPLIQSLNFYSFHLTFEKFSPDMKDTLYIFFQSSPIPFIEFDPEKAFYILIINDTSQNVTLKGLLTNSRNFFFCCFQSLVNIFIFLVFCMIFKTIYFVIIKLQIKKPQLLIYAIAQNAKSWFQGLLILFYAEAGSLYYFYFIILSNFFKITYFKLIEFVLSTFFIIVITFCLVSKNVINTQNIKPMSAAMKFQVNSNHSGYLKIFFMISFTRYILFSIFLGFFNDPYFQIFPPLAINILYLSSIIIFKNKFSVKFWFYYNFFRALLLFYYQIIILFIQFQDNQDNIYAYSSIAFNLFFGAVILEIIGAVIQYFIIPISFLIILIISWRHHIKIANIQDQHEKNYNTIDNLFKKPMESVKLYRNKKKFFMKNNL